MYGTKEITIMNNNISCLLSGCHVAESDVAPGLIVR